MIKRYEMEYDEGDICRVESEKGEWIDLNDIEKVFNNFKFPQLGDDNYIDGFNKAYELLNEAIFGK
jgi:hypothetical protein